MDSIKRAEQALLDRFRTGDAGAFDALVRRHADAVYRFALRLTGRAHEAEDVAQETFARALRHARTFRQDSGFRTWLFRIAVNIERDAARRRRASPFTLAEGSEDAELESTTEIDASLDAESRERRLEVREMVDRLPELQRESLVLRVYEDLSYAEIAEILGISVGAAKMNLLYARRKLAGWLRGDPTNSARANPALANIEDEDEGEGKDEDAHDSDDDRNEKP